MTDAETFIDRHLASGRYVRAHDEGGIVRKPDATGRTRVNRKMLITAGIGLAVTLAGLFTTFGGEPKHILAGGIASLIGFLIFGEGVEGLLPENEEDTPCSAD